MTIFSRRNRGGSRRYYARKTYRGREYIWPRKGSGEGPWRHRWQAQERAAEVEKAIADGTFDRLFGERRVPTLREAGAEWFATGGPKRPWSEATKAGYASVLRRIDNRLGGKPLTEINRFTLEGYKRQRRHDGVDGSTVNRELAAISSIFGYAIDGGIVEANPARAVDRFGENADRWVRPDPEAIEKRFLRECRRSKNPHLYGLVLCAYDAGLRKSEALRLRVEQVSFDAFPQHSGAPRGAIAVQTLKQRGARRKFRTVPMTERLRVELLRKKRKAAGPWLFPSPASREPYTDIGRAFHAARRRAEMAPFRFHDLRHGFASILADAGEGDQVLAALLGHADSQMVSRYSHVDTGALERAATALERKARDSRRAEVIEIDADSERFSERPAGTDG
jgi:integrase